MAKNKRLPTPKVGDRVVSASLMNLGRHGTRLSGYSDPSKRMSWVRWDDGEVSGEFTKSLIREKDYPKTVLYRLLNNNKKGKLKKVV